MTYKIVRFFESGEREVVATGLSREEAVAHCNDPDTSSKTTTIPTRYQGAWFDGFEKEDDV